MPEVAQAQRAGRESGIGQRYTKDDIALFRQIKTLLSNGHNYEQAQAALSSGQPDAKPKRSSRRPAGQKAQAQTFTAATIKTNQLAAPGASGAQALTPSESMNNELVAPRASSEQVIAAKDKQIAELEQMLQVALRANNEWAHAEKE